MATGIISAGTALLGPSWLSLALLAAASAGLVVLGVALCGSHAPGTRWSPPSWRPRPPPCGWC
jgi:hypothetical protein